MSDQGNNMISDDTIYGIAIGAGCMLAERSYPINLEGQSNPNDFILEVRDQITALLDNMLVAKAQYTKSPATLGDQYEEEYIASLNFLAFVGDLLNLSGGTDGEILKEFRQDLTKLCGDYDLQHLNSLADKQAPETIQHFLSVCVDATNYFFNFAAQSYAVNHNDVTNYAPLAKMKSALDNSFLYEAAYSDNLDKNECDAILIQPFIKLLTNGLQNVHMPFVINENVLEIWLDHLNPRYDIDINDIQYIISVNQQLTNIEVVQIQCLELDYEIIKAILGRAPVFARTVEVEFYYAATVQEEAIKNFDAFIEKLLSNHANNTANLKFEQTGRQEDRLQTYTIKDAIVIRGNYIVIDIERLFNTCSTIKIAELLDDYLIDAEKLKILISKIPNHINGLQLVQQILQDLRPYPLNSIIAILQREPWYNNEFEVMFTISAMLKTMHKVNRIDILGPRLKPLSWWPNFAIYELKNKIWVQTMAEREALTYPLRDTQYSKLLGFAYAQQQKHKMLKVYALTDAPAAKAGVQIETIEDTIENKDSVPTLRS